MIDIRRKKYRGYIFSRPFMGERVPQHVQNIVIRDYCNKKNFNYLLIETSAKMVNKITCVDSKIC